MNQITTTELKRLLNEGPTTFRFRKLNGEVRKMTATTNSEWIPEKRPIVQMSDTAITVYDLECEEYRRVSEFTDLVRL